MTWHIHIMFSLSDMSK